MPDHFVPLDTLQYTAFHRQLVARGIVVNATLQYVDNHRKELQRRYADFGAFERTFEVPQAEVDSMIAKAAAQKLVPRDDNELSLTLPQLKMQFKALVARDIWDMNQYFQIINQGSHIVQRAIAVLDGKED